MQTKDTNNNEIKNNGTTDDNHEDKYGYDPETASKSKEAIEDDAKSVSASGENRDFMDDVRGITSDGLKDHMDLYSAVLQHYTRGLSEDISFKTDSKKRLFSICMFIMCAMVIALFISVIRGNASVESCVQLVLPFMTTFIVIPKTITEYLFNGKDSEAIANIVDTIRQHDEKMLELTKQEKEP